ARGVSVEGYGPSRERWCCRRVRRGGCVARLGGSRKARRRERSQRLVVSFLRTADGWKTRVLDHAFQIFFVGRHSINRIVLFARGAAEKKNIVVVDPNAIPAEKFFRREPACFLRLQIERPK